jgi:anti-sigma factor RsiW
MSLPACQRIALTQLTGYAVGDLPETEAAALEEHLFSCADCSARAAELDGLVRAIAPAVRSAEISGFITDAVLNRLSREGVRVRTFTLSPGAIVPCAVWEDDEVMVLRLRGDFGDACEFRMSQRVAGDEVIRVTAEISASQQGELLHAIPAAWVRQLPAANVEVSLTAIEGGQERPVGSYTLVHGGSLHRR